MPRLVEFFSCEICGEIYDSSEKATECEAKGTRTKFAVGEPATVWMVDLPPSPNPGVVTGVEFEKKTHRPLYTVKCSDGVKRITE